MTISDKSKSLKTNYKTQLEVLNSLKCPDKPYGHLQWKGINVCMDINCICGELTHVDGEFCYHVKCGNCGKIYFCNPYIEFIEVDYEPEYCILESS